MLVLLEELLKESGVVVSIERLFQVLLVSSISERGKLYLPAIFEMGPACACSGYQGYAHICMACWLFEEKLYTSL